MANQQGLDLPTLNFNQAEHLDDALKSQYNIPHLASRDERLRN